MKAKKFKTPNSIEVGEYIAPKTVEIDGRHCAMCGRLLGSTEQSTEVYLTHSWPHKGDVVEVTRGEHLHAWHILVNGGGAMDGFIGNECIKKIKWSMKTLTKKQLQEIEDYG